MSLIQMTPDDFKCFSEFAAEVYRVKGDTSLRTSEDKLRVFAEYVWSLSSEHKQLLLRLYDELAQRRLLPSIPTQFVALLALSSGPELIQ
jgi:hypothetical protein